MENNTPEVRTEQQIVSAYMRSLAKKSHSAVKAKYGADYYRQIRLKGWSEKKGKELQEELRAGKENKDEERIVLG